MDAIKVMLVDDHAVVRAGYRFMIDTVADMAVAAEADSGEAALILLEKHTPDVVVLDLTMPGMGGMEAIKQMLARKRALRILVCSMHDSSTLVERALQAGAAGYFCKNGAPDAMLRAIRKVAAGEVYIDPELEQSMVIQENRERNSPLTPCRRANCRSSASMPRARPSSRSPMNSTSAARPSPTTSR
jgi:two-component system invasion response regulator UvrY